MDRQLQMKYFLLVMDESCSHVPQLKNTAKDLLDAIENEKAFMKLSEHMVIPVTTVEQTVWSDILRSPVFLISKKILEIVRLYDDTCLSKEVIFLDKNNAKTKVYCVARFEQTKGTMICVESGGKEIVKIELEPNKKINKWTNIFQVEFKKKIYTVVNLDLAESILRRNLEGVGLKEVVV